MKLLILIFLEKLILNSDIEDPRCIIENKDKVDCAKDIKKDTVNLERNCNQRGCCYQKVSGDDSIPWCYNKSVVPTTIVTTLPTTIITTIPIIIPTTISGYIPTTIPSTIPITIPNSKICL